jgi:electron transport complex protein RnfC
LRLVTAPVPKLLQVSLNQHIGVAAEPLVATGARVSKGQPVAATVTGKLGALVHAPTSGVVARFTEIDIPGRGPSTCLILEADDEDRPWDGYPTARDPLGMTPVDLRAAIIEAGIVGLGGAMFPTGVKLNPGSGIRTLILNGVECEPQINCDDALMREYPGAILRGAQIMLRILEADDCIVAIKESTGADGRNPALDALAVALANLDDDRIRIAAVPPVYPVGGEAQLIEVLTGLEIPSGGLPWDTGVACQNVGTAAAITQFFRDGEPLISRIVTVTGRGVHSPVNVVARIGTPVAALIECAGGYRDSASRLILGGPMMGRAARSDALPITKASNCIYVAANDETWLPGPELPCIRCSDCATVCPASLTPQIMLEARRNNDMDRLERLGLMDCIECGCCDYVCPSQIPLTRNFHDSKHKVWDQRLARRQARRAERRHVARDKRLRDQADRDRAQLADIDPADTAAELEALKRRVGDAKPTDRQ